jgi:signal transduction histidine kinase
MFKNAALKLTGWYLAIIMALSIGCSLALYSVSSNDLSQNTRRQFPYFTQLLAPDDLQDFTDLRQSQLDQARNHLKANLVLFNIVVLVAGGVVSYALARRTLQPLEDSLESQTRFTGDASHELRTPLTVMQSEIEVALRDKNLTKASAVKLLGSNLEEVGKLKALSEGLLRLAQGNELPIKGRVVSLKAVIEEVTNRTEKQASAKKIKIENKARNILLTGDFQSLVELFVILVDNAIKYSPNRSTVKLSSKRQGKLAEISVQDSGLGIKASDLPRIFDRFYRADNSRSKENTGGYGLGLAIARKITEAHKGFIEVKSIHQKGSTFMVSIPVA